MAKDENNHTVSNISQMNSTSPTTTKGVAVHPRRSAPADAVSLPQSKRRKLSYVPTEEAPSNKRKNPSSLNQHNSNSTDSDRSASKWFAKANENIPSTGYQPKPRDDEPPFYLGAQKKAYPQTFISASSGRYYGEPAPTTTKPDSENDDLRGVIDDLTIENKRLRQILKGQQRSESSTTGHDKLFEVRVHGLSARRKHELETLLKNFATKLQTSPTSQTGSPGTYGPHLLRRSDSSLSSRDKATSAIHADSGYGSQSNSGVNSALTPVAKSEPRNSISAPIRDKSIKNYLHDIPDTLLPRKALIMSERSKMILVVRKLEQLFTGRKAVPGAHAQPMQQQEVSDSAARADRLEDVKNNRRRKSEGTREAHILPYNSKVSLEAFDRHDNNSPDKVLQVAAQVAHGDFVSQPGSPDQRPTRPLDLDIHRAQVGEQNWEYIRHLGLFGQEPESDNSQATWVFLNLLMGMAQLHTINVTPEYVRKAVRKFSTKLELSKDCRRVKWRGGIEGTKFSHDDERALEVEHNAPHDPVDYNSGDGSRSQSNSKSNGITSDNRSTEQLSGKQTSSSSRQNIATASSSFPAFLSERPRSASAFDYKPIVYTGRRRHLPDLSYLDCSSSQDSTSGDSNGLVQALSRSNLDRNQQPDEGIITFYSNPSYYSDLTGDRTPVNFKTNRGTREWDLLGTIHEVDTEESALRHHDACYFTPQFAHIPQQPSHVKDLPGFDFSPLTAAGQQETIPIELPACGVGSVNPADNFAVDVKIARLTADLQCAPEVKRAEGLVPREKRLNYVYKVEGAEKIQLQDPKLPPPTYVLFASSSSSGQLNGDDDSDLSDSESSSSMEDDAGVPAFLTIMTAADSELVGDEDDNDESSVDMLQMARAMDPAGIAAQEREYLINQPGGLNAVAGSLAATVGASRSSPSASVDDSGSEAAGSDSDSENETDSDSDMDVDE